jgi:hypothetical protein
MQTKAEISTTLYETQTFDRPLSRMDDPHSEKWCDFV